MPTSIASIFGIPYHDSLYESGLNSLVEDNRSLADKAAWEQAFTHAREDLEARGITIEAIISAGGNACVMRMRDVVKSVVRIGKNDFPISTSMILKPVLTVQHNVPDNDHTLRMNIVPFAPDVDPQTGQEIPENRITQQDMINTLRIINAEGFPIDDFRWDGLFNQENYVFLRGTDGQCLRYPAKGVPAEYSNQPIAFVRDYNLFMIRRLLTGGDMKAPEHEPEITYSGLDNALPPLPPIAADELETLKRACNQDSIISSAREELEPVMGQYAPRALGAVEVEILNRGTGIRHPG